MVQPQTIARRVKDVADGISKHHQEDVELVFNKNTKTYNIKKCPTMNTKSVNISENENEIKMVFYYLLGNNAVKYLIKNHCSSDMLKEYRYREE